MSAFFGPQSRFSFNYRGNWSATADYDANDAVRGSNGRLYVATENNVPRNTNPVGATRYWAEIVSSSVTIPQGPQGIQGQKGDKGDDGDQGNPGMTGPRGQQGMTGPQGNPGNDGMTGPRGPQGNPGSDGDDGLNGYSSTLIYRKANTFDYTAIPTVTYDGTRPPDSTSLTLPAEWSTTPYVSQNFADWNNANITTPQDLVVDLDEELVYILQDGTVYKFNYAGTPPTANASWNLNSGNTSPASIAISSNNIYVLDTNRRSMGGNFENSIFVYNKTDGAYLTQITIATPQLHPQPRAITIQDSQIYVISPVISNISTKAIRVFNIRGVEQGSLGLNRLPSTNDNPTAITSDDSFLYVLDGTDDKVYVYERLDPERRFTSLEFDIGLNTLGLALSEFELFTIRESNNDVYRFYNPRNALYASVLFVREDSPYTVTATPLIVLSSGPSVGGDESVTVVTGGGGGTGAAGTNGDSARLIFRAVASGATAPDTPTGGTYSFENGSFTAPSNWHLTVTAARAGFTNPDLYASAVRLPGDSNTPTYTAVIKLTGDKGDKGDTGNAGASIRYLYRAETTGSPPARPTGGSWDGSSYTNIPANWSLDPPATVALTDTLYVSEVRLPGIAGTPIYSNVFAMPRGSVGPQGAQGPKGDPGNHGTHGDNFLYIFREATAEPSLPTGGSWDGTTFRAPSNWLRNSPTRSANDPENLYATGVELPGGGGTPHYTGVFQLNGIKGDTGDTGPQGTRGIGTEWVFIESSTPPDAPTTGSGTWNYATDAYTPPSGWSLNPGSYSGSQHLYASKVTLPGSSNDETYSPVVRLDGPQGATGQRGPAGPAGGASGNDDSLDAIYRKSSTNRDSSILGTRPTGGTASNGSLTAAPSNWSLDVPTNTATEFVYISIATIDDANAITYDLPIQMTGQVGAAGAQGNPGNPGTPGTPGAAGAMGNTFAAVYRNSTTQPTAIAGTQGLYNTTTGLIGNVPSGWTAQPSAPSGNERTWASIARVDGSNNNILGYNPPIPLTGEPGPQGQRGMSGAGGGNTVDGDPIRVIYQRSTTVPANPSGGTWVESTQTYTPPANWYLDEANTRGTGRLYVSIVTLSGSDNTIVSYSPTIAFEGPQGIQGSQGPKGDKGDAGAAGAKGDKGDKGDQGTPGKFTTYAYQWAVNQPTRPNPGRYDGGFIHNLGEWHQAAPATGNAGEYLWQLSLEVNPSNNSVITINVERISGPPGERGQVGPQGTRGPAGRDGVPGIDSRVDSARFDIIADSSNRTHRSTRTGPTTTDWTISTTDVRGNYIGDGNQDVATLDQVEILRAQSASTGSTISTGFINSSVTAAKSIKVTPTGLALTGGQTSGEVIIVANDAGGTQTTETFTFSAGASLGVAQATVRTYMSIVSVRFTNFSAGTVDIDFEDGILIATDGLYQITLQAHTEITQTSDQGELALTLYIETSSCSESVSFVNEAHDLEDMIVAGVDFPDLIVSPLVNLQSNDRIYFVYAYRGTTPGGARNTETDADMTYRTVNYPGVDERIVVRKFTQGSGGSATGGTGEPGESFMAIWNRATATPATPSASDITLDRNGRFTSLTSNSVTWDDEPPTSGPGINYKQNLGVQFRTNMDPVVRLIGTPVPDGQTGATGSTGPRGPQGNPGNDGATGPRGTTELSVWTRSTSQPSVPTSLRFNTSLSLTTSVSGGLTWYTNPSSPTGTDQLWRQVVTLDFSQNPIALTWFGTPIRDGQGARGPTGPAGGDGNHGNHGNDGSDGNSADFVYQRSSSTPTAPTNGTGTWNGSDFDPPSGWYAYNQIPGGSDPIYAVQVYLSGTTKTAAGITYGDVIRFTGETGARGATGATGGTGSTGARGQTGATGPKGDALQAIWTTETATPATPGSGSISINSSGVWTDLVDNNSITWTATYPTNVPVGMRVFRQLYEVDYSTNPPTLTALGIVQRDGVGDAGPRGIVGPAGPGGRANTLIFQATSTATAPTRPTGITYTGATSEFANLGDWSFATPTASMSNPYIWVANLTYTTSDSNTPEATQVGFVSQFNAVAPYAYQYYYHANTAETVTAPTIDYNGTSWNPQSGWTATIPTSPAGANVFLAPVRYRMGIDGEVVEGVVRFGTVPGSVTPPPSRMTYASGITYGLAVGNNPVGTAHTTSSFSLAVGESHTTAVINFPQTTATNNNYYIRLPAGLTFTAATGTIQGDITSNWARVGSTQVWVLVLGAPNIQNDMTITVRRDS